MAVTRRSSHKEDILVQVANLFARRSPQSRPATSESQAFASPSLTSSLRRCPARRLKSQPPLVWGRKTLFSTMPSSSTSSSAETCPPTQGTLLLGLRCAFRECLIEQALHFLACLFRQFPLLLAQLALELAQFPLLLSQRAHLFPNLRLALAGFRLALADLGLELSDLGLDLADLLRRSARTQLLQFCLKLLHLLHHVGDVDANLFHLLRKFLLLAPEFFLLAPEFFLLLAQRGLRRPEGLGAPHRVLIANDVGLA